MSGSEMPPGEKVRLASVGLGSWAGVLARAIARGSVAQVVNCWSRSPEARSRFQEAHGIARAAGSLDELLSDPEVEGVVVTTPNDAHKPVILEALDAGKAVYVDKPITHDLKDALAVKRTLDQEGRVFTIGHSARRLSGHRVMKDWVDSGRLGGISMAEAHFTTPTGINLTPDSWRYFAEKSPGGALIQLGVHHTDTLQYILGPIVSVSARAQRLFTTAEVPDTVMVLLEFESGALGTLATGWAAPGLYQMRLYGTDASLHYDVDQGLWARSDSIDSGSRLEVQPFGETRRSSVDLPESDMFREEIEEFALAIRGRAEVEVTLDDAIRALAVVMAAVESSERGGAPVAVAEVMAAAT